jgi:hypothetical protein
MLPAIMRASQNEGCPLPWRPACLLALLLACLVLLPVALAASPVAVRHAEGILHGFVVLRTQDGTTLAEGDMIQVARGDQVTSQLLFHFKDGSVHDETAVYSQRRTFRLLSYHLVQKGPSFPHPMDVSFSGSSGQVKVRYSDEDGKEKVTQARLKLPPDVANGIIFIMLKNVGPDVAQTSVSMVAATPEPRLVKVVISPQGEEPFSIGGSKRTAMHYVLKIEIGGLSGFLAPLLGKQPPDIHAWILSGNAPAIVRIEGPLFLGGPIWRIELISPVWPADSTERAARSPKSR